MMLRGATTLGALLLVSEVCNAAPRLRGAKVLSVDTPCGTPKVAVFYAGQTLEVGTVTAKNNDVELCVEFQTNEGWYLEETHLHIASNADQVPATKKGNPKIGLFDHQQTELTWQTQSIEECIPLGNFEVGKSYVIAAHASVYKDANNDGFADSQETAWAAGTAFVDKGSWATYFTYTVQACGGGGGGSGSGTCSNVPETQGTSYAFAPTAASGTCFLDLDLGKKVRRWGWTLGPFTGSHSATYQIYRGAGQCDISKGTLVGSAAVSYDGSQVSVTISANAGFSLNEYHIYAGPQECPSTGCVANGQFNIVKENLADCTSTSSTAVVPHAGEYVYVIIHSVFYDTVTTP